MDDVDDEMTVVGRHLPRITSVRPLDGRRVAVTWMDEGARDPGTVDLGATMARFKVYAPLRADPALFATVHVQDHGYGVAWGDGAIDMASTTIADAAEETMTAEDFSAFMTRHGFTLDRVAAELGISRRMASYYRKSDRVPRVVALACRYIDGRPTDRSTIGDDLPRRTPEGLHA